MRSIGLMLLAPVLMVLSACNLGGLTSAGSNPPPQLPAQVTTISRTAIDFALNSFDAALYGVDYMVASGKLTPGSDKAKAIAAAGRKVMAALNAAEAARQAGNSASYGEAFGHANDALTQFRTLIGKNPTVGIASPPISPAERLAYLDRLAA